MSRLAEPGETIGLAALAIAVGILSNTILKLGIALVVDQEFRRLAVIGLACLAIASGIGIAIAR
jgi:hypothetical protein